jgi:hypothetical protein
MSAESFTLIDTESTLSTFKVDGNTFNPDGSIHGLEEYLSKGGAAENLGKFT